MVGSSRTRFLILWCARLVLLAYVFQTAAFEHWKPDPAHVYGFEGSSLHAFHCHSERASCADSSSLSGTLADVTLAPLPPVAIREDTARTLPAAPDAFRSTPDEPPRTA
jgi:hypothetical protein